MVDGVSRDVGGTLRNSTERGYARRRRTDGEGELVVDGQSILVRREQRELSIIVESCIRSTAVYSHPRTEAFSAALFVRTHDR